MFTFSTKYGSRAAEYQLVADPAINKPTIFVFIPGAERREIQVVELDIQYVSLEIQLVELDIQYS